MMQSNEDILHSFADCSAGSTCIFMQKVYSQHVHHDMALQVHEVEGLHSMQAAAATAVLAQTQSSNMC